MLSFLQNEFQKSRFSLDYYSGKPEQMSFTAASIIVKKMAVLTLVLFLAACTSITFSNAEAISTSHIGFPVLNIESIGAADVAIRRRGFGIFAEKNSLVVGYLNESTVYVRDASKCKIVIFARTAKEVEDIEAVLRQNQTSLSTICFVKG